MNKVLCICGGRDHYFDKTLYPQLKKFCEHHGITTIIQGGATGIDNCALEFAAHYSYQYQTYLPNWKEFGKAAGPMRNRLMAEACDIVLAFPGGNGTADMIKQGKAKNKDVYRYINGNFELDTFS